MSKKYMLALSMFAAMVFLPVQAMYAMDKMEIVVESKNVMKDLHRAFTQITKSIFLNKSFQTIKLCVKNFIIMHAQCENPPALEHYFKDILKCAVQYNRLDVTVWCWEDCKYGLSLVQQYELAEKSFMDALRYGSVEPYKYLLGQAVLIVDQMTLSQRMCYDFECDKDHDLIVIEDDKIFFEERSGRNRELNYWDSIFSTYWVETRWLTTRFLPNIQGQLVELRNLFDSHQTIRSLGYKPDFNHLDSESKSLFYGSYYNKALFSVCAWYKQSKDDTKKIIKECAQICGHAEVLKALQVCDNSMHYVLHRSYGLK